VKRNHRRSIAAVLGGLSLVVSAISSAQIKAIPKEGLPGLSKEAVEFEIEHNYRRENNLGMTVSAEPGTPPNSSNPQVLDGTWVMGRVYTINVDGTYTEAGMFAGGPPPGSGIAPRASGPPGAGGLPGGGGPRSGGPPGGAAPPSRCGQSLSFGMALPSEIVQTDRAMYIFNTGTGTRRIEMTTTPQAQLDPTIMGHSIGRWEGDTLIVVTTGLKKGGTALAYGPNSQVTERIKKIEAGLKLENIVTIFDTVTGQSGQQRVVSFYRPDLHYVEAPCEEYSDPFEGQYETPAASAAAAARIVKAADSGGK
jgi:hypothetical protein